VRIQTPQVIKGGQDKVGTLAISNRGCVSLGSLTMKPRDRTQRFPNIGLIKQSNTHSDGNRKGTWHLPMTKKLPASAGKFFLRIASESEKVFARILDEFFRFFDLPKTSVFSGQTIQNFKTLTPPLIF